MLKVKNLSKTILILMSVFLLNANSVKAEQKDCQGCSGSAFQTVNGDQQKPPGWNCVCINPDGATIASISTQRREWGQTLICGL